MNVIILTNILTPYRKFFFDYLNKELEKKYIGFNVLIMYETEPGRTWMYDDLKSNYTILLNQKNKNKDLKKKIEDISPEIIILAGSYTFPIVWRACKLSKNKGIKTIFWSESHMNENKSHNILKFAIREIIRNIFYKSVDGFCYAGQLSKELIINYSKNDTKLFFLPNIVDDSKFNIERNVYNHNEKKRLKSLYNIECNKFIFFCPARLEKVKGIEEFINIYKYSEYKSEAIILIAGEGSLKEHINKIIESIDGIDVRLLGSKSENEIIDLYKIADCFLLPSLSDPNPLSCIEALWSGLPLLISNHVGNYPEVVVEGKNGYVFSYGDIEDSLHKIDNIISSSYNWRENASILSKDIANKVYNPRIVSERLVENIIEYIK